MSSNADSINANISSLDDLFSKNLDELDDLPSFETPPPGTYILELTMDGKDVNKKAAVEARFSVREVVELKDGDDKPPAVDTQFSTLFLLNEFGIGKLKSFCAPLAAHFNEKNIGVLVRDHAKNVTVSASVKNRKDKEDPDKIYAQVEILTVA